MIDHLFEQLRLTFTSNNIVEIEEESFVNITGGCRMYAQYSKILFEFVTKLASWLQAGTFRERIINKHLHMFFYTKLLVQ
jgi:hypothetical protein